MDQSIILAPSILSADFSRLGEELTAVQEAGIPWAHLDIMDGAFVPNLTFGPPVIASLRKKSSLFFDCHLMIERPERYIQEFVDAGADLVCVHAEATVHLERAVTQIADAGAKAAVALNPATPLDMVEYLLPQLHMVLIMSVNPGFGGQTFIPFSLEKIKRLKAMIEERKARTLIQVDGGITPENVRAVAVAGANVIVSGSAFFKFPPYKARHELFQFAAAGLGDLG